MDHFENRFYYSTTLGVHVDLLSFGSFYATTTPTSFVRNFFPYDMVEFSSHPVNGNSLAYEVNYTFVSPESFTEVFRLRALAARPLEPAAMSVLPPWGFAVLAGFLMGVSFRVGRRRRINR